MIIEVLTLIIFWKVRGKGENSNSTSDISFIKSISFVITVFKGLNSYSFYQSLITSPSFGANNLSINQINFLKINYFKINYSFQKYFLKNCLKFTDNVCCKFYLKMNL